MTPTVWMLLLVVVGLLVAAGQWWLGLWSSFVTFVNVLLAGLVATSFYTNVANAFLRMDMTWVNVVDFVCIWLLFVVTFVLLRGLTEVFSRYSLKFHPVVEMIGRTIGAAAVAVAFLAFACYAMLLAPMPQDAWSAFSSRGVYPENSWGGLTSHLSQNSLAAHGQSQWFGNAGGGSGARPAGDAGTVATFGNSIRASIEKSTNLRIEDTTRIR